MAISIAEVGTASTGYGTSISTSAFTPTADSLLLVNFRINSAATGIGISGHGTWTQQESVIQSSRQLEGWAYLTGGSPSNVAVTASWSAPPQAAQLQVLEVTGGDVTSLAAAIVQSNSQGFYNGGAGPDTNTITLSAFDDSGNTTFFCADSVDSAEAGFTLIATFSVLSSYAKYATEDTSPSWDTLGPDHLVGLAYELAPAAAGGGGIEILRRRIEGH